MQNPFLSKRTLISFLLAASLAAPVAFAQTSATPEKQSPEKSALVRLNHAPVSNEVLNVHLPRPVKTTLSNGVRLLVLEDHRFPSISLEAEVDGAGPLYDPADQVGLAQMTASLLRQGTATKSSKELSEAIEKLGADINSGAAATRTEASISASGLKDNFDEWFSIFADILLHPSFPVNELAVAKQRQLAGLQQQLSSPSFLASKYFRKTIYGDSPAGVVSPTPASLSALTAEQLKHWYEQRYTPQNTIIIIAGDISATEAKSKVEAALKDWKKTDLKVALPETPKAATSSKIVLVDRPASVQTNLLLGNLAIDRKNPDYVPLTVANSIFGGGTAGRLFMKLREEKGYTYGAYSRLEAGRYPGVWVANSEVRSAVTEGALQEFFNEFHHLAEQPASIEELKRHERSLVANFAISLESRPSLMSYALTIERYGLPDNYWDEYAKQVVNVSAADVQRVAAKYISPSALQVVAVGDPSIKAALAKYGTVEEITPKN